MMQSAIRILVVDDEPAIRRALRPPLVELGFQVAEASRGEEALQALRTTPFDAVLLDINMPGIGGIETLQAHSQLCAAAAGADAYGARRGRGQSGGAGSGRRRLRDQAVQHAGADCAHPLRGAPRARSGAAEDAPIEIGEIRLEPVKRRVTKRGEPVRLTRKEFDILYCLMSRAGRVVTYAKLLTAVWGAECREEVEYLRTFVRQLRKKIEDDPSNPLYLLTDVYVGYRFADAQMFQEDSAAAGQSPEDESVSADGQVPKDGC